MSGLRVLTWNIQDLLGDPRAVVRLLRAARPDVACLQEAPRWPGSRSRLAALARASGLSAVAGGRASAGTAIMVSGRVAVGAAEAVRLAVRGVRTRPRGAVLAEVAATGATERPLTVVCIHLGLDDAERRRHVAAISHRLRSADGRAVIAGDFNEAPGGPSWRGLAELARDPAPVGQPTFPVGAPRKRLDAVLVGPKVEVLAYDPWQADPIDLRAASDHRPVVAVLR